MSIKFTLFALLIIAGCATADLYLHNPRGSNNRLDEQNRNRQNANRLFDSQNNNKGGYNQNDMVYYGGSWLHVEWTNQHSCGDEWNNCQLIFQYMCEPVAYGTGLRDGQVRNSIDEDDPMFIYGRHETATYYKNCEARERNKGLFLADQDLTNDDEAIYTRQNTNGNQYGLECPEERDYYPYWHPTPWKDIAVLTDDAETLCPMYTTESQNVMPKNFCNGTNAADPANVKVGAMYNNEADCLANGLEWLEEDAWGLPAPDCLEASEVAWSRINHLGNGPNGWSNSYDWQMPNFGTDHVCVFRARYNISTNDYDPWNTFADQNGENSPVQDNPTVDLGEGVNLKLSMNTDQFGRTFQDRSSTFIIKPNPGAGKILNLNVKGQRGNIVQNYPSVEYDYSPTILQASTSDNIHFQVTGSDSTPAGAGRGTDRTDRSNFVQIDELNTNYPTKLSEITMIQNPTSINGYKKVKQWALLGQNAGELNDAAPHQDFGLMKYSSAQTVHFMGSRNNDFTNRSQKGSVVVNNGGGSSPGIFDSPEGIAMVVGITVGGIIVISLIVLIVVAVAFPSSALGSKLRGAMPGGSGGSKAPMGYS